MEHVASFILPEKCHKVSIFVKHMRHYDSLLLYVRLLDELLSQIFIKHIGRYILGAVSIFKLNGLHMSNANCKVQSVFQNR